MNCEQFDNRVQQLLDERASLSLDLQIHKHANECDPCRSALEIYECMAVPATTSEITPAQRSTVVAKQEPWKQSQRNRLRKRAALSLAAMLFIGLILVNRPPAPPVAEMSALPDPIVVADSSEVVTSNFTSPSESMLDFSGLLQNSWTSGITDTSYVDLTSLSRIDLVSWMPKKEVMAMQSIPATIESIEPIYRYSTDFPVLNQWSSGINYTIGLIQSSIPSAQQPSEAPEPDDLGSKLLQWSGHLA